MYQLKPINHFHSAPPAANMLWMSAYMERAYSVNTRSSSDINLMIDHKVYASPLALFGSIGHGPAVTPQGRRFRSISRRQASQLPRRCDIRRRGGAPGPPPLFFYAPPPFVGDLPP